MATTEYAENPDRNLALELVRATEAAAIRSAPWVGRGDKNGADGAAVDGMRAFLRTVTMDGVVVIGEGEKDEAPMLFNGEHVGNGFGPACDVAVDPIDGTTQTAAGRPNAVSVIAVADRGSMYDPSAVFYMEKLVTGPEGIGVCDLSMSVGDNIRELAKAKHKSVADITVVVLDRPRHEELIDEIRAAGARTTLILDGDVIGGIDAASATGESDMLLGIGGTPEGVITACAVRALGGLIQGKLWPKDDAERQGAIEAGHDLGKILSIDDLVATDNTYFVATGVTDGLYVQGVQRNTPQYITTHSVVMRSRSSTIRSLESQHAVAKWYV